MLNVCGWSAPNRKTGSLCFSDIRTLVEIQKRCDCRFMFFFSGAWEWEHLQEALEEKLKNSLAVAQLMERIRSLLSRDRVSSLKYHITVLWKNINYPWTLPLFVWSIYFIGLRHERCFAQVEGKFMWLNFFLKPLKMHSTPCRTSFHCSYSTAVRVQFYL